MLFRLLRRNSTIGSWRIDSAVGEKPVHSPSQAFKQERRNAEGDGEQAFPVWPWSP